ncbi:hypothetical protein HYPSUDRAFT_51236 [Hypholoma sublateritium FD-334 SS-4]|uniref:2,5-diamino-6-ribosylamino-4(3H)-pyrimidinone 5'-phosphate reductase n=1 Tax=Hypholoma sublateritium (strain FD-334 SS-4) TaxID=945553 RepID=A0A0D2PC28_HYPSF|nr:hypothetical protein HYPSUDRAFT_51236 [Hypholoma sublateritium FD-334 SS-4]
MADPTPPTFLAATLLHHSTPPPATRPHVTLTFAQSLDAKIAGAQGRQLILSGKQSMVMTHWLRTLHDAILVGINTALNDDPQLNEPPHHLPRPVVVDARLRLPVTCKLLRNFQGKTGRRPWVLCAASLNSAFLERKSALEAAGARVIEIPLQSDEQPEGRLPVPSILHGLRERGVNSLMVEGGARIIASFLAESVVDALIVTVAPVLVGEAGVGYQYPTSLSENGDVLPKFKAIHTETLGQDTVMSFASIPW